jgi:ABC-type transport system substrate-binding protein
MAKTRERTLASDDASEAVISRRNVLKLGALGVGGLALGRGFLAHDRESLRSVNFATRSSANQTLRVGTSIPLSTLDPNLIDTAAFPYRRALFDPLLSENITDFKTYALSPLTPWLATKSSVNSNYTRFTFYVRPGVNYSDGTPVTAQSIVKSLEYSLTPGSTMAAVLTGISKVAASGNTVIIEAPAPNVGMISRVATWLALDPSSIPDAKSHPVGTGPFVFSSYEPGTSLTATRNPNYWKPLPTNVAEVQLQMYPTTEAVLAAALAGEIDILQFGDLSDLKRLKGAGWSGYAFPVADYENIIINFESPNEALHNQLFRQAVALCVDRETIVRDVFQNQVLPLIVPMPPSAPQYLPPDTAQWNYNPAKAKQLLKESGVKDAKFTLYAEGGDPISNGIVEIIKSDLAKVGIEPNDPNGIDATIQLVDSTTIVSTLIAGDFEVSWFACSVGVPDPSDFATCSFFVPVPNAKPLDVYKEFPAYVAAWNKASTALPGPGRVKAYQDLFQQLLVEAYSIAICQRGILAGQAKNIHGVDYDLKSHLMYNSIMKS